MLENYCSCCNEMLYPEEKLKSIFCDICNNKVIILDDDEPVDVE